jgi:hypothetical protein
VYSLAQEGLQAYVSVGDGFRLAFPHRIPARTTTFGVSELKSDEDDFELQGAVTSKIDKGVKAISGTYSNIKAVTDRAVDVAGKVSSAMVNFDTPNDGSSSRPVEPRYGLSMANMDGVRFAQVLGPMQGEPPLLNVPTGTTTPETRIHHLSMMTCLYTTVRFQASDAAGTILLRIPITPCPELFAVTSDGLFQPTMMEHVATGFTYWKGGIHVTVQCVGPSLANARIGIASRFGSFGSAIPLSLFSSQYGKVFNYGEEDTLKFSVPYLSPSEWMRVPVPDALGGARANPEDYALGEIVIMVITPYQVNETMADAMDINVFLAGAEDMEFKTPGENLSRLALEVPVPPSLDKFEPQMLRTGASGGEFNDDEKKEVEVRSEGGPRGPPLNVDGAAALWGRIHMIDEIAWDPADVQGTIIWQKSVPDDVIPAGPVHSIYHSFMYSRMTMTFSFGLSSSVTSQGQLIAFFCPLETDPADYSLKELLLMPHVLIKAGRTSAGILQVPYVHPLNALQISAGNWRSKLGTVALLVFNQFAIGAGASAQNPTVNVGVQFNEMELSVPDPTAPQFLFQKE